MTSVQANQVTKYQKLAEDARWLAQQPDFEGPYADLAVMWDEFARYALGLRDADYNFG